MKKEICFGMIMRIFGSELRLLHRYDFLGQIQALAMGVRYFKGNTQQRQGLGPAGFDADFQYNNPNNLEDLAFRYPFRKCGFIRGKYHQH